MLPRTAVIGLSTLAVPAVVVTVVLAGGRSSGPSVPRVDGVAAGASSSSAAAAPSTAAPKPAPSIRPSKSGKRPKAAVPVQRPADVPELVTAPPAAPVRGGGSGSTGGGSTTGGTGSGSNGNPVGGQSAPSSASGIAASVFNAVNSARANAGLPALRWNSGLVSSAHQHNLAMARANTMSHQLPGEAALGDRETAAGVHWSFAAENIGWTTDRSTNGALSIEASMLGEKAPNDGHRQNILSKTANSLGVDVIIDAATGKLWLTEDFAAV